MNTKNIIALYKAGERHFRNLNLNNLCLRRQNLADATFKNCEIKSTDFSQANLSNVRFIKVKTGLSNLWLSIFLITIFLFLILQSIIIFSSTLTQAFILAKTDFIVTYAFYLSLIIIAAIVIYFRLGQRSCYFKWFNLPFLLGFSNFLIGAIAAQQSLPIFLVVSGIALINGIVFGLLVISLAITFTTIKLIGNKFLFLAAVIVSLIIPLVIANFFALIKLPTLGMSIYLLSLALYLSFDSLKVKASDSWIYQFSIFLCRQKNTSFYQSNLENTEFVQTNLNCVDLRRAKLNNSNLDYFS